MGFKKRIKEYVKRHDKLYVAAIVAQRRGDPNLANLLRGYYGANYDEEDYLTILSKHVKREGARHKALYLAEEGDPDWKPGDKMIGGGLCAQLRRAVESSYVADLYGFTPVAFWGKGTLYREQALDDKTENVFEYYYEPLSGVPYREIANCEVIIRRGPGDGRFALRCANGHDNYTLGSGEIAKYSVVYSKYFRLNRPTRARFEKDISTIIQTPPPSKVLGVHYRGTDFNQGLLAHPVVIGIDQCVKRTREVFDGGGYGKIFLATDDQNALDAFRAEFGGALAFYPDVLRSSTTTGVHSGSAVRPLHRYLLGLEVLRDVYTLACCDSLICGRSQVAFAARYVNLALGRRFERLEFLDNGINFG